jgi:hypothetical protein
MALAKIQMLYELNISKLPVLYKLKNGRLRQYSGAVVPISGMKQ